MIKNGTRLQSQVRTPRSSSSGPPTASTTCAAWAPDGGDGRRQVGRCPRPGVLRTAMRWASDYVDETGAEVL